MNFQFLSEKNVYQIPLVLITIQHDIRSSKTHLLLADTVKIF